MIDPLEDQARRYSFGYLGTWVAGFRGQLRRRAGEKIEAPKEPTTRVREGSITPALMANRKAV